MYYVPDKHLEPPEDIVFCLCDACGEDIYVGDMYYKIDNENIHDDCLGLHFHQHEEIAGE